MYGAIKGRFNLDFGFPLCFDLDWFAEREWLLHPGSAVMAATRSPGTVHCTRCITHHYRGKKRVGVVTQGDRGGGME